MNLKMNLAAVIKFPVSQKLPSYIKRRETTDHHFATWHENG